jgi:TctA family transporter
VGATAVLSKQIDISSNFLFLLLLFVLSMSIAILVVYSIRKQVAKLASLDFSKLNSILAIYLIAITWIIDGFLGVGILFVASGLGWLTLKMEVERTNLMGAIIVPTLLLLFGVFF